VAALILRNISKSYAKQTVLEDFSLEIPEAEFLVLVGPSGCGKSTLIRSIAGLETIDAGEIIFRNQRIDTLAPKDRQLSMVFQNYALYPHKTVYDNIAVILSAAKDPQI
jgi:ABC-type sugar transport system ATPase subunit